MGQKQFYGTTFTTYEIQPQQTNLKPKHIPGAPLHRFGNGPFCEFPVPPQVAGKRGLYIFIVDEKVRYAGRCLNDFSKRIKEYGHIAPSDRLENGQQTNCHVNAELNKAFVSSSKVEIGICPLSGSDNYIKSAERNLLDKMRLSNPFWNINY